jgi:hypothetical protein
VVGLNGIDSAYINEVNNKSAYTVVFYVADRSGIPILPKIQTTNKIFLQNQPITDVGPFKSVVFKDFRLPFAQENQGRVLMLLVDAQGRIVNRFVISVQGDDRVVKATIYNRRLGQVAKIPIKDAQGNITGNATENPLDIAGNSIIGSRTQYVILTITPKGYPFILVKRDVSGAKDIEEILGIVNTGLEVVGKVASIAGDIAKSVA